MNKPNWQEMIRFLNVNQEMTYAAIADEVGCAGSTIGDIATGRTSDPGGTIALNLYRLYESHKPRRSRK